MSCGLHCQATVCNAIQWVGNPLKSAPFCGGYRPPSNIMFLEIPASPHTKQHLDQASPLCMVEASPSLHFTMGWPFRIQTPHLIHRYLGPPKSTYQLKPQLVQPFLHESQTFPTDRQTNRLTDRQPDHATTGAAIGRIYAVHTMRSKK